MTGTTTFERGDDDLKIQQLDLVEICHVKDVVAAAFTADATPKIKFPQSKQHVKCIDGIESIKALSVFQNEM